MPYVEVYNAIWQDFGGTQHEVKLLKEGGSNIGLIAVLQPTPWTYNGRGGKNSIIKSQIRGSEAKFNFMVADADIFAFRAIFESDYKISP